MEPFVLCFTGISGSGKTTLANAVAEELEGKVPLQILDGDVLRNELGNLFGYTRKERMKQNKVVKVVSSYLLRQNINVLIALVAPYDEMRKGMRSFFGENYYQVYVDCPYSVCAERDVKGYYKLMSQNQMKNLNGADDVYEVPTDSELSLDTSVHSLEFCTEQVISFLQEHGYGI